MSIKQDRDLLKTYFETGDRPTEEEFAELIHSGINQVDDAVDVNADQNVGIGKVDAQRKLHVAGKTFIGIDSSKEPTKHSALEINAGDSHGVAITTKTNDVFNFFDDGQTLNPEPFTITDNSGRGFRFYRNASNSGSNGERLRIADNGNVGIGTQWVDPEAKLEIQGNSGDEWSDGLLRLETAAKTGDANLRMGVTAGSHSWIQSHNGKPLAINRLGNHTLLNEDGGNVGIGTATPEEKLHVAGNTEINGNVQVKGDIIGDDDNLGRLNIHASKLGSYGGSYVHMNGSKLNSNGTPNSNQGGITFVAAGDGKLNGFDFFHYNQEKDPAHPDFDNANSGNPKTWDLSMRINGEGNVGIGTNDPKEKLHVNGNIRIPKTDLFFHDNSADDNHGIGYYGAGKPFGTLNVDGPVAYGFSGGALGSNQNGNKNVALRWMSNGNVGVGIHDPDQRLDVDGSVGVKSYIRNKQLDHFAIFGAPATEVGPWLRMYPEGINNANAGNINFVTTGDGTDSSTNSFRFINYNSPLGNNGYNELLKIKGNGNTRIGNKPYSLNNIYSKLEIIGQEGTENNVHGIIRVQGNEHYNNTNLRLGVDYASNRAWIQSVNGELTLNSNKTNVGIGRANPNYLLHVGEKTSSHSGSYNYLTHWTNNIGSSGGNQSFDISIYADGRILGIEFNAHSDGRIKNITRKTNSIEDLASLQQIEITDYKMKDVIGKGNGTYKKVIGQQLRAVFPQAVSLNTEVIPDIYQIAKVKDNIIQLDTDLKLGEKVKLIFNDDSKVVEVTEVLQSGFKVNEKVDAKEVFVFGREVDDFHVVDYDAISMLNVSATQELAKKLDRQEKEIEALRKLISKQTAQ